MLEELRRLKEFHPSIGDMRGIGLMVSVELVKNRESREQFAEADDLNTKLTETLKRRGLLTRAGAMISLAPPPCITRSEVDEIVGIVDESIGEVEQILGIARFRPTGLGNDTNGDGRAECRQPGTSDFAASGLPRRTTSGALRMRRPTATCLLAWAPSLQTSAQRELLAVLRLVRVRDDCRSRHRS